ncbi:hypothetical protein [Microbacterium sp. NPDC087589]|uniref:hypothetical protein n=1 Tax=Microbacterium sp. NPDC087589 TaxID=3364191 RepID=UPI0037FD674E
MRLLNQDDEQPGRPNSPGAALTTMVLMGLVLVSVLVVAAPVARAMLEYPTAPGDHINALFVEWVTVLHSPAKAVANVVSAFAVLMLTLFIEEGLKASDKVPVRTRRNIATFAFVGGVATVGCSALAVLGATFGGNVAATIQTVGSAAVVLFFASHIATHSVISLTKQRRGLLSTRDLVADALRTLHLQGPLSFAAIAWVLAGAGTLCFIALPAVAFVIAEALDPANSGRWVSGLLGVAYLAFAMFFLTCGTTPGNSAGIRVASRVGWGLLAIIMAFATAVAFALNMSESALLPSLFFITDAVALLSIPAAWMPRWTLTGAARTLQLRALKKTKDANDRAIQNLDAWEATLPQPPQSVAASASQP